MTSISAANIDMETDYIPAETEELYLLLARRGSYKIRALERRLCGNAPQRNYAFEKEKMRAEEGKGPHVIRFWEAFKTKITVFI